LSVGIYEVAFTVVLIGSTVSRWGLDTVLVREMARDLEANLSSRALYLAVLSRVFLLSIICSAAVFFGSQLLTDLFFQNTPTKVIVTAALAVIPFTLMLLNAEVFRAMGKSLLFSLNQHGTVYVFVGALIGFMPFSEVYTAAAAAQTSLFLLLAISGLFFLCSTVYILSITKGEPAVTLGWKGQLYSLGTPMLISSSLFLVISWSDTLILGYYLPEDSVGIYRIVFKIATLITFAQFALNTVVAPMVSAMSTQRDRLHELAHKVAQLNLITAGPIFIGIISFGPFLIQLFGVEEASAAHLWLVLLAVGQLTNAFAGPVLNILNMTGYEKSARNTMLIVAVLNIVFNLLLIPLYGPLGAAVATTVTMISWNIWAAYLVYKYHGVIAVPFLTKIRRYD
ncbi:MAG TPA: hypothetical protein DIT65_04995, partial [Cryomorphaceae bacterium]|nr:hypothetical protein [Cryomorphaceae bacterium]